MKIISEYFYASVFVLAAMLSFSYGEIAGGFVLLVLCLYFPQRNLLNDLVYTVNEWDVPRNMIYLWTVFAGIISLGPISLLVGNYPFWFASAVAVGIMSFHNE